MGRNKNPIFEFKLRTYFAIDEVLSFNAAPLLIEKGWNYVELSSNLNVDKWSYDDGGHDVNHRQTSFHNNIHTISTSIQHLTTTILNCKNGYPISRGSNSHLVRIMQHPNEDQSQSS